MYAEEFSKVFKELVADLEATLVNKASDYATDDVLSNFKVLSRLASELKINVTTPLGYALFMVLMKLHRICNLLFIQHSTPKNESVYDSFKDLDGYSILALALYEEKLRMESMVNEAMESMLCSEK